MLVLKLLHQPPSSHSNTNTLAISPLLHPIALPYPSTPNVKMTYCIHDFYHRNAHYRNIVAQQKPLAGLLTKPSLNQSRALAAIFAWRMSFTEASNHEKNERVTRALFPLIRWSVRWKNVEFYHRIRGKIPHIIRSQRPQSLSKKDNRPDTHKPSYLIVYFPSYFIHAAAEQTTGTWGCEAGVSSRVFVTR